MLPFTACSIRVNPVSRVFRVPPYPFLSFYYAIVSQRKKSRAQKPVASRTFSWLTPLPEGAVELDRRTTFVFILAILLLVAFQYFGKPESYRGWIADAWQPVATNLGANFGTIRPTVPEPVVRADVVLVVPDGATVPADQRTALADALRAAGWDAPSDESSGLPSGGVLAAIRTLWSQNR